MNSRSCLTSGLGVLASQGPGPVSWAMRDVLCHSARKRVNATRRVLCHYTVKRRGRPACLRGVVARVRPPPAPCAGTRRLLRHLRWPPRSHARNHWRIMLAPDSSTHAHNCHNAVRQGGWRCMYVRAQLACIRAWSRYGGWHVEGRGGPNLGHTTSAWELAHVLAKKKLDPLCVFMRRPLYAYMGTFL